MKTFHRLALLLLPLCVLVSSPLLAQQDTCQWGWTAGGISSEVITQVKKDKFGNIYATGEWRSPTITVGSHTFNNAGLSDIMLLKFNSNGALQWCKDFYGPDADRVRSLQIADNGYVYIAGNFINDIQIGTVHVLANSYCAPPLPPCEDEDIFVAKFSPAGDVIWARNYGNNEIPNVSAGQDEEYDLKLSKDQKALFLYGFFDTKCVYGGDTITAAGGPGDWDVFLFKLDTLGNVNKMASIGSTSNDFAVKLDVDDDNNAYIAAIHVGNIIAGPWILPGGTASPYPVLIAKYDSSLTLIKAINITSLVTDIKLDKSRNVYVNSMFNTTATVNTTTFTSHGNYDILLTKLDNNLDVIWNKQIGGPEQDGSSAMVFDKYDNLYLSGDYQDTLSCDSVTIISSNSAASAKSGLFVLKLDSSGHAFDGITSKALGAAVAGGIDCICVDSNEIYVGGTTQGNQDYGNGVTFNASFSDYLVLKYLQQLSVPQDTTTGIALNTLQTQGLLYPDPASLNETVHISYAPSAIDHADVYNIEGRLIKTISNTKRQASLEFRLDAAGLYVVRSYAADGSVFYNKLLIK